MELGLGGASVVEMAHVIGVVRNTLETDWPAAHPEFMEALTRARQASQVWWEATGRKNLATQGFQSSMWSRSMAARFPKDWRETKGTEFSGAVQIDEVAKRAHDFTNSIIAETAALDTGEASSDG